MQHTSVLLPTFSGADMTVFGGAQRLVTAAVAAAALLLGVQTASVASEPTPVPTATSDPQIAPPITSLDGGSLCNGPTTSNAVLAWYQPAFPWSRVPLRCGNSGWGWVHIQQRWNPWFNDMIQITVSQPTATVQDGTNITFKKAVRVNGSLLYTFIVVVEYRKRADDRPMGIITAYQKYP